MTDFPYAHHPASPEDGYITHHSVKTIGNGCGGRNTIATDFYALFIYEFLNWFNGGIFQKQLLPPLESLAPEVVILSENKPTV